MYSVSGTSDRMAGDPQRDAFILQDGRSPTNRCPSGANSSRQSTTPLVDTIAVKGPIAQHRLLETRQRHEVDPDTGETTSELLGGEVDLRPGVPLRISRYNGRTWARIEQSVPVYLNGLNTVASTVDQAAEAVRESYDAASTFVDWDTDWDDLRVVRLDLPRDFDDVTDVSLTLDGLAALAVPRTTVNARYADPARGGAQSLRRGVARSWHATLYDKTGEVRHHAARTRDPERRAQLLRSAAAFPSRMRFEPSIRRRLLERRGIHTVSDLAEDGLSQLSRELFIGIAAGSVDISYEGRGPSGRMSLCRRSTPRSSSGMWSRSPVAVI